MCFVVHSINEEVLNDSSWLADPALLCRYFYISQTPQFV
jgi:hypothetical protein